MKWIIQLLLVAPVVGFASTSNRIIHGTPVHKSDAVYWQTVRLIERTASKKWFPNCTGSVIAPDLILTSAHCVESLDEENLRVGYEVQPFSFAIQNSSKKVDVLKKFKTSKILGWVTHPKYGSADYDYDLAVIKIDGTVAPGFSAMTILPKNLIDSIVLGCSYTVQLVGYGMLEEDPWVESEVLRQAEVSAVFEGLHLVTDQSKGYGGCHGDSGGPALLKVNGFSYLVGVTHGPTVDSHGCRQKGVWVNPALETDFLNEAAEKLNSTARF
jgi:secreted trypsin-like serine protease